MRLLHLAAAAGAVILAGASIAVAQTNAAPPGDAKAGGQVYLRDGCYECHGTMGQGSGRHGIGAYGPLLAPNPLPWSAIVAQVRHPRDLMPAFSPTILSDQDLANIYAYLKSIPAGKDAKDIPILRGYLPQ